MRRLIGEHPVPAHLRGLTLHQLHALHIVSEEEYCTMGMLATRLHISLGAATGLADRLIQQRLVERAPDPNDRRVVRLQLTAHGRQMHTRGHREAGSHLAQRLSILSHEEQVRISQALLLLLEALTSRPSPET